MNIRETFLTDFVAERNNFFPYRNLTFAFTFCIFATIAALLIYREETADAIEQKIFLKKCGLFQFFHVRVNSITQLM